MLIVQHRDFSRFKDVARLCDLVTGFGDGGGLGGGMHAAAASWAAMLNVK